MPLRRFRPLLACAALLGLGAPALGSDHLELLMFEQDGCSYCARWLEEVGPIYPKTSEGAAAPLKRTDLRAPLPEGTTLTGGPPTFTPTFVLTDEGTEVGRLVGYAGDEFFWVLLDELLEKAGWDPDAPAPSDAAGASPETPPAEPAPSASPAAD